MMTLVGYRERIFLEFSGLVELSRNLEANSLQQTVLAHNHSRHLLGEGEESFAIRDVRQVFPGLRPPLYMTTRPTTSH